MPQDGILMQRALLLAEGTAGLASPNPMVGCVIARGPQVLGEGAHVYDKIDHAEIVALKQAAANGHDVLGATAYVTLEPCSHQGRTGPCADALIKAGISRCVVATVDPNPAVRGRGLKKLRDAGIEVTVGLFQARARRLNDTFAMSMTQRRPRVTLKAALSVDGHLAPSPSQRTGTQPFWLTGPESREEVQQLRHRSDAILTGIGTVLADDPLLTDRTGLPRRRPLMRVVLDTELRTPITAKLVQSAQQKRQEDLWIFCGTVVDAGRRAALERLGVKVTSVVGGGSVGLTELLGHLHKAQILSVLVEAGSAVNGAFLQSDLVDEVVLFYSETELGEGAVSFAEGTSGPFVLEERLKNVRKVAFGADVCVSGLLHDPWPKGIDFS